MRYEIEFIEGKILQMKRLETRSSRSVLYLRRNSYAISSSLLFMQIKLSLFYLLALGNSSFS